MIGIFGFSQTNHLDMIKESEDDFFKKSQSILPVYKYDSTFIEPYSKFGLQVDNKRPWYTIKQLPNMQNCRDTGYTYIYFSGASNNQENYILALIGNYKRSRRTVYFFIDRNNDLDFSIDGSPDSMTNYENVITIRLKNMQTRNAQYAFKLTRFKYGENVRYKNLLTEHYKSHSGKKLFTNINYCYREQRYNAIIGHYKYDTDSFSIGVKDMNVNGIYNDGCIDKYYVGPYKSQIISDELHIIKPDITSNHFEWGGKLYSFNQIESSGDYIEFSENTNVVLSNSLKIGRKTPNFSYYNVFNVEHELKDFKRQRVYLFFWDKGSITEEDTMYLSKINKEFQEQIKLITLNHGDEPKQVKIVFYYDKIKWPVGYSNNEISKLYFLENVPRGFYLGKRRMLINDKIRPKEMYMLLKKELDS